MGDFEKTPELGRTGKAEVNRAPTVAILMALIAFLAPVAVAGYNYGYGFFVNITAMLWSVYWDGYNISFQFLNMFTLMSMIPFLMFRVAFVYQITRYYQGKTTRGRTTIAAVLSEAPILAMYVLFVIAAGMYSGLGLNFPSPIMMLVGLLLLLRFPVPEATVPWESAIEPTPWWEESPEEKTDSTADNQPW